MKNEAKKNQLNIKGLEVFGKNMASKVQSLSNEGIKLKTAISMAALNEKAPKKK